MYNLYIRQGWGTTDGTLNWSGNTPASVSLRAASEMAALYACATHCAWVLMVMWPKHIQVGLVYLPHPISIIHPSIIQVSSKYHPSIIQFSMNLLVYHPYLSSTIAILGPSTMIHSALESIVVTSGCSACIRWSPLVKCSWLNTVRPWDSTNEQSSFVQI